MRRSSLQGKPQGRQTQPLDRTLIVASSADADADAQGARVATSPHGATHVCAATQVKTAIGPPRATTSHTANHAPTVTPNGAAATDAYGLQRSEGGGRRGQRAGLRLVA